MVLAFGASASAVAQTSTPQADIPLPVNLAATLDKRAQDVLVVLQGKLPAEQVFSPTFRAAVPDAQLLAIAAQLEGENGKLLKIEKVAPLGVEAGRYALHFERAVAASVIQIEQGPPYRVVGFRITSVTPSGDGPPRLLADFAALPGSSGFGLFKLDASGVHPILTSYPAQQFAIGSTFKLWVLDAVAEEVAAKRLRWDQVVRLGLRSVPSGLTQDWPSDAPVTVETLATLMISRSDNTATDTLMRLVGRDRIDARLRASAHSARGRMWPMLTTLEAFALKAKGPEMAAHWAKANVAERLTILVGLQRELDPGQVMAALTSPDRPMAIESIEWFASPEDIARILDLLRQRKDPRVMAILGVNPALPDDQRSRFSRIGFKGGSEPGVISMSYLLQGKDGAWYVASASWNDPAKPLDEGKFQQLMLRLVAQLP